MDFDDAGDTFWILSMFTTGHDITLVFFLLAVALWMAKSCTTGASVVVKGRCICAQCAE